jgi:hypothetical protein
MPGSLLLPQFGKRAGNSELILHIVGKIIFLFNVY